MPKWEKSDDICPRCKQDTEYKVRHADGHEYHMAERCTRCRWIVDFEADKIQALRY